MRKILVRGAAAQIGIVAVSGALAQEANPYYVGVSQAFTRESNVFRVATGLPETSDTYSTTSLLAGINQPISRQRLFADAAVNHNRYDDQTQLNNTGYRLASGLDWETVENLSGRFGYNLAQTLARFGADQGPALTTRNMERTQELLARGQYNRASRLSFEAAFAHRRLDYSASEFAFEEFRQNSGSLGVLYRPSGQLTLGAAVRHTKGRYPFAIAVSPDTFLPDDFKRNDLDLTAVWEATGLSTVSARLSYTREEHEALASRDISGATGALRWDYKPTAKLTFATELIRDSGAESSFTRQPAQGQAGAVGNNSRLSSTVAFRTQYEATAKIRITLDARYVERELVNTFALSSGGASSEAGTDKLGVVNLGLRYAPTRSLLFGCAVGREKRGASSAVSYGYTADVASCFGQFTLQ